MLGPPTPIPGRHLGLSPGRGQGCLPVRLWGPLVSIDPE